MTTTKTAGKTLQQIRNVNKFVESESRLSGNWLRKAEKLEIEGHNAKLKQAEFLHRAQEGLRNWRYGKRQRWQSGTDKRRTG